MAGKFEVYKDKANKLRWRLKAGNGEPIAAGGEAFDNKTSCENQINSVKKNAPDAPVVFVDG